MLRELKLDKLGREALRYSAANESARVDGSCIASSAPLELHQDNARISEQTMLKQGHIHSRIISFSVLL